MGAYISQTSSLLEIPTRQSQRKFPLSKIRFIHVAEETSAPAGPAVARVFLKRGGTGGLGADRKFLKQGTGMPSINVPFRQVGKWRLCFRLRNFLAALYLPIAI